jgi:hypothetical protein
MSTPDADSIVVVMTEKEHSAYMASKSTAVALDTPSHDDSKEYQEALRAYDKIARETQEALAVPWKVQQEVQKQEDEEQKEEQKDEEQQEVLQEVPSPIVLPHPMLTSNTKDACPGSASKYGVMKKAMNIIAKSGIAHVKGGAVRDIILHGSQVVEAMKLVESKLPVEEKQNVYNFLPHGAFVAPTDLDVVLIDAAGKEVNGQKELPFVRQGTAQDLGGELRQGLRQGTQGA